MKQILVAILAGLIFGIGLTISGMTNPNKVIDFLNISAIPQNGWDPSLAFVMIGGIAVAFIGVMISKNRIAPILTPEFHWPAATSIDRKLIIGSSLFGIGWGLIGFCPGPAFAALAVTPQNAILFIIVMGVGSFAGKQVGKYLD